MFRLTGGALSLFVRLCGVQQLSLPHAPQSLSRRCRSWLATALR